MAGPANPGDFKEALVVLGAAAVVVPIFHRLKLSPVLGFMLVGMAVGPSGLGALAGHWPWLAPFAITSTDTIAPIAELGVVMLMFVIGLEMSFARLKLMRRLVFGFGTLQLLLSALAIGGAALLLGLPPLAAAIIGLGLAMSSTAVVVQVLAEEKRLTTLPGRAAIAVLLLQDLAVVPILFAVDALEAGAAGEAGLLKPLLLDIGKAAIAVVLVMLAGRLVLRPLFRSVARTGSPELFVAACLLVVLGTGLAMASAGLSMTLGALLAGLLLAETEYRRQVQVTIEPFKGLLLGVFLVSVGMTLSLARIAEAPFLVLGAALLLVAVKAGIVLGLARLFGLPWTAGLRAGLLLGPGGEFSLVVVALAVGGGLIGGAAADTTLVLAALTMAAIPLLSQLGERLARPHEARRAARAPEAPPPAPAEGDPQRVIIAGFGRVGQTVADMLEVHRVPYIALDSDPDLVARERRRGRPVYFGDMTQLELLRHLDLDQARGVVVTLTHRETADALVGAVRRQRADLLVVVRARDADHAAHLYAVGATDAVPETIEASLQLAEAVLVDVGIAMGPVIASIHEKRAAFQSAMRARAPGAAVRPLGRGRLRDRLMADSSGGGGGGG